MTSVMTFWYIHTNDLLVSRGNAIFHPICLFTVRWWLILNTSIYSILTVGFENILNHPRIINVWTNFATYTLFQQKHAFKLSCFVCCYACPNNAIGFVMKKLLLESNICPFNRKKKQLSDTVDTQTHVKVLDWNATVLRRLQRQTSYAWVW